jgi:putative redox protein
MARASARIAAARYRTDIRAGTHALVADEGAALGGMETGPAPYELLLAALGACTAMTLKMYAERKGWPLAAVEVDLAYHKADDAARIDRQLSIEGPLDADQRARLADIAERTPVTLTLKSGVTIVTQLQPTR